MAFRELIVKRKLQSQSLYIYYVFCNTARFPSINSIKTTQDTMQFSNVFDFIFFFFYIYEIQINNRLIFIVLLSIITFFLLSFNRLTFNINAFKLH